MLNEKIDERKEQTQHDIGKMRERILEMENEMKVFPIQNGHQITQHFKKLRAVLYAKFGDNIQLEDESNGNGNNIVGI